MGQFKRARGPVMEYEVKKLKEWQGMDGYGCHGEIHHLTQGPVANFRDEGSGGGLWPEAWYNHKTGKHCHEDYKKFVEWADAHPVLDVIWKEWGFTPSGNSHADTVVEFLMMEHKIDKEIRKGYLVYQLPGQSLSFCGAKTGRKKTKYSVDNLEWLKKVEPTAICRNCEDPEWVITGIKEQA